MPCLLDLLLKKDLTLFQKDDEAPYDALFSSLCFWNASTICSGTDSSLTVSYTHLDVYKRQAIYRQSFFFAETLYLKTLFFHRLLVGDYCGGDCVLVIVDRLAKIE